MLKSTSTTLNKTKKSSPRSTFYKQFINSNIKNLDCGSTINRDMKLQGKAAKLFNIMVSRQINYKIELSELVNNRWFKWTNKDGKIQSKDFLSISDIKQCILYYYLLVTNGTLKFKGEKRMLMLTVKNLNGGNSEDISKVLPNIDANSEDEKFDKLEIVLTVVPYVEKLFNIETPKQKSFAVTMQKEVASMITKLNKEFLLLPKDDYTEENEKFFQSIIDNLDNAFDKLKALSEQI